jgi:hypothetical protein
VASEDPGKERKNVLKLGNDVRIFDSNYGEYDDTHSAGLSGAHPGFTAERRCLAFVERLNFTLPA